MVEIGEGLAVLSRAKHRFDGHTMLVRELLSGVRTDAVVPNDVCETTA